MLRDVDPQVSVALGDPRPNQRLRGWIDRACSIPEGAELRLTPSEYRDMVWVMQTEGETDAAFMRRQEPVYLCLRPIVLVPENDKAPAPKGGQ